MVRRSHRSSLARIALAVGLAVAALAGGPTSPIGTASGATAWASDLSRWNGGIDLYRAGSFTTQQTWLWCTAANVQIARNIVDGSADHSRAGQQRYFDYMRAHNRYRIPVTDGVDPGGWTAGLRQFVDGRYRLVASSSFESALRSAVTNLRRTNLPVAITVAHGDHAWLLTGFTATADPSTTERFSVTSVRVVGPLWGLQSRSYGYDMPPDTMLTPRQLATFFTPWHYAAVRMAWEGAWVSIQPIASTSSIAVPPPTLLPSPTQLPSPTPTTTPSARPASVPPASNAEPSAAPVPLATADPAAASPTALALVGPPNAGGPADSGPAPASDSSSGGLALQIVIAVVAVAAIGLSIGARARRRPGRG